MASSTIAIIGATGSTGRVIAAKLAAAGENLLLISEEAGELEKVVSSIRSSIPSSNVEAIDCLKDACWEADIIFLAVHAEEERDLALKFREVATQKIVVRITESDDLWGAEALALLLPDSKIVSARMTQEGVHVTASDAASIAQLQLLVRAGLAPALTAPSELSAKGQP